MESTFPFGLPAPTAFYLTLYVATFATHQAFMHYVLAGSMYVAWATIAPARGSAVRAEQPLASTLRDWMPFALSAAITAGVAPLLFVQIVYPRHFYTANLLLSWRWMIVIPILIVAFYLLYLVKSSAFSKWPYGTRAAVVLLVAASFLFVGFCWTANHLIGSRVPDWPQIYSSGELSLSAVAVTLRVLVWIGGACASMAVIAGWQLATRQSSVGAEFVRVEMRRLAWFSLAGLGVASTAAVVSLIRSGEAARAVTLGTFALPYAVAAIAGVVLQSVAWARQLRAGPSRWLLVTATFGCVLTLGATSVVRESVRLVSVDISQLYARHSDAAAIEGLTLFLTFAVVNVALIASCIWLVRREVSTAAGQ